jgi:hypothetical protein
MTIRPSEDNEIRLADALNGAAAVLTNLATKVMDEGDVNSVIANHFVFEDCDDAEQVGAIKITRH